MELLFHYVLPVLAMLIIFPKLWKPILLLSIITILPDFDWVFGHRFAFHNLLFVLVVSSAVYLVAKRNLKIAGIAGFFAMSHIILDLSNPGVPLAWPLSPESIALNFGIFINSASNAISFSALPLIEIGKKQLVAKDLPLLSEASFTVLIFLAIAAGVLLWERRKKSKTSNP
jgi:membrane-bound metal-dependent hydrolase YbcI (DUF457 family)